ncbi:MAG: hypothetical protein KA138_14235 [Saprospiraceae bacterium]|jgi:tetratricopeptide (TPR) repeat protein|nr:hypothetical protein [Saprospiraceae bacterium]
MKHNENRDGTGTPQEPELSTTEQQLLKFHLDRERINRWEKVIARSDKTEAGKARMYLILKWATGIAATILLLFFWKNTALDTPRQPLASIAGMIDYPFMEQQVRGTGPTTNLEAAWKLSIAQYQKREYSLALETSKPLDNPFFEGMCLLHLKRFDAAINQFDRALEVPGCQAEITYYKAVALQQMGRKAEAKVLLNQTLARKDLREAWKKSIETMLRE